ncbi:MULTISPECIES: hypothetical protein [unclassified Pseudomonas]|uniref:hypothetical protein n=1 Tax=unclassified Pseudomonas TaxID=196821 RepID=UPI0015A3F656|nr:MULTISPECIES: hypothetical protein [unclassified Pseudomonas]NWC95446.1 hypothetical protein [Pseudomonas sp. IPO3779]NWD17350.1 hypothetical protein [Pseudomonas sp. IPO3778]
MGLLIILPLLVSGYLVCIKHPYYYCRLHRFEGQLLYLHVARLGLVCLVVATLITALLLAVSKQAVYIAGHELATDYSRHLGSLLVQLDIANDKNCALWIFLLQTGLTALVIPFFWARFYVNTKKKELNLKSDEQLKYRLALGTLEGTPFKLLLKESIQHYTLCMFSLSDRKVYVGIVIFAGVPTESEGADHAFTLVPILSGYRDKDTLEITLNTPYRNTSCDPSILLLQETVVSVTRFDFSTWNALRSQKNRKIQMHNYRARPIKASGACA